MSNEPGEDAAAVARRLREASDALSRIPHSAERSYPAIYRRVLAQHQQLDRPGAEPPPDRATIEAALKRLAEAEEYLG